ncbi:MAG: hypothetical protein K2Q01_03615, partial [Rickettsiales bacterium]|nr:hypothetical protein [Rickettsiales bacterium]
MRQWVLVLTMVFWAQAAQAAGPFHPPMTDAEKALARIIEKVQDDALLPKYLLMHSSPDPAR